MDAFYVRFVILIVSSVAIGNSQGQKYEYDVCKPGATKKQDHICLKISNCPSALAAQQKGDESKICSYSDNIPIVCCPPQNSDLATPKITVTRPKRAVTTPKRAVTIVNEWCSKYKESQFELKLKESPILEESPYWVKIPKCKVPLETLILNGEEARPGEFPHMALLGYGDTKANRVWNCDGSLISERYVLTAAHCIVDTRSGELKWVRLGELDHADNSEDARPEDFNIAEKISHPNYSYPALYNDIALLKLDREVKFSPYIRPLCLDTVGKITESKAIVAGWGQLGPGYIESNILMKVTISFVDYEKCKNKYGVSGKYKTGIDAKSQICAGDPSGTKDACQGDSGGPLKVRMREEPCMYVQLGIVSFGSICGMTDHPGVYTRVFNYLNWIQPIVWPQ